MTAPTLAQQADELRLLLERTWGRDYKPADRTLLWLTKDDADRLEFLANRLERMAPHEPEIRRIVQGRRRG